VSLNTAGSTGPVRWEVREGLATIELNRPDASNALDLPMAIALNDAVVAVSSDPSVSAVLLLGRGRNFCAGGDVTAMAAAADRASYVLDLARSAHRVVLGIAELDVPVVAAVQGAAAGAGLALTLVADVVLAGSSAKFLTAYAGVGLTPDCGTSWLLPRIVGLRRALELTLTNRRLTAAEALEWGLITGVGPDQDISGLARQVAEQLAIGPSPALGITRRLVRDGLARNLAEQLEIEATTISHASLSPAAEASLNALAAATASGD
jgi:2-(1,2-epoxy-1,2-dihydrophenyl)acetyl-CoA isomerase